MTNPYQLAIYGAPPEMYAAVGEPQTSSITYTPTPSGELLASKSDGGSRPDKDFLGIIPIPNALGDPLGIGGLGDLLKTITSPTFWLRVGEFILGGLLMLVGVYLMASESAALTRLKSSAESAAVVAAAA